MSEGEKTNPAQDDARLALLLHDFKNHLGGLKLYAAFLRKSLLSDALDRQEGIAVCDKMIAQLDALSAQAKAVTQAKN